MLTANIGGMAKELAPDAACLLLLCVLAALVRSGWRRQSGSATQTANQTGGAGQMPGKRRYRSSAIENGLMILGVVLIGIYVAARIHGFLTFRAAMRVLKTDSTAQATRPVLPEDSSAAADSSAATQQWSEDRIKAYQRSTIKPSGTPLAILRIPKLELEVPVLEGTDALTLNGGVGRIAGTAMPGEQGNIGIAGHRDSYFHGLKDVRAGDIIELAIHDHTDTYIVEDIEVTSPDNVSVLRPSPQPKLTLVTCFPFNFVGPAPQRFIVQAVLKPANGY